MKNPENNNVINLDKFKQQKIEKMWERYEALFERMGLNYEDYQGKRYGDLLPRAEDAKPGSLDSVLWKIAGIRDLISEATYGKKELDDAEDLLSYWEKQDLEKFAE